MFSFNSYSEAYNALQSVPAAERGHYSKVFVWLTVADIVYYIVVAVVIILLGRRLIQASFAAFKESRRERT